MSESTTVAEVGAVVKRGPGAPPGNQNRKLRGISMPPGYDLTKSDEVSRFMREVLVPNTLNGKLSSRQSSTLVTMCKTLLQVSDLKLIDSRLRELESQKRMLNER